MPISRIVAVVFRTDSPCSLCRLHAKASARGPTCAAAQRLRSLPRMTTTHSTSAAPTPRPLPAHLDHHRSDRRQLLLVLLPAVLTIVQLASAVRGGTGQLRFNLLVHLLGCLSMRVPAVLLARTSPRRPTAGLAFPARERRRLPLGHSLRRLQLTLQLPDALLQPPNLGLQAGVLRLGGVQGQAVLGDGLRLRHGVRRKRGRGLN